MVASRAKKGVPPGLDLLPGFDVLAINAMVRILVRGADNRLFGQNLVMGGSHIV